MPHRHTPPTRSGPVIIALAILLLVIAGGVLGAAYYLVLREEEKPAAPPEVGLDVPEQVIPFDRPTVDERTGAWVLEFEAHQRWREPGAVDALLDRARACRDFVRDGRFARLYPEAPKSVRLRIICAQPLRGDTGDRLRAGLDQVEGIEIELRGLDPAEFR
ncbi:MAG: hypothetical protein ACYTDU_09620 [Planctomycetota bacterium]|jgi:hypothetical protein